MPVKRSMFLVVVLMVVLAVQGCETLKGAQKDAKNLGANIQTLDQWMTEHLW